MSRFIQGDCLGSGNFIGSDGRVNFIMDGGAIDAGAPFRCDEVRYRTSQPWKQNANVADVLPSAAHTANRAIERMISQSPQA